MSEQINSNDVARLRLQEQLAERNGFSLPPPFFALGTPLVKSGTEAYQKSRRDFDSMPPAQAAIDELIARVEAECRRDVRAHVQDLRMLADGRLVNRQHAGDLYVGEGRPFAQLLGQMCDCPSAAATYLASIPSQRRAAELNALAADVDPEAECVLRTRSAFSVDDSAEAELETHGRELYAVVSKRYGTGTEVDAIARLVRDLPEIENARADLAYDGYRARIGLLWHTDLRPESVAVGEVFKAGAGVETADDTTRKIDPYALLFRAVCKNFTTMEARRRFAGRKHLADAQQLAAWLAAALREAIATVLDFPRLWDRAAARNLAEDIRDGRRIFADLIAGRGVGHAYTPVETEREMVEGVFRFLTRQRLAMSGQRGAAGVQALVDAWNVEPQFHRAGVVNAITRAAHQTELASPWTGTELEKEAGAILASDRPFTYLEAGQVS